MATRADPNLMHELKEYGAVGIEKCFNCGNCTAICPLTSDGHPFPRNNIRMVQLGMREDLKSSLDPWLCYYCGDCSATCPKEAEPGETQMAVRRWLTAQYDWTGLAKKFYTSKLWEIGSVVLLFVFILAMFGVFHGPMVTDQVELNTFAPVEIVHVLDWIMALGLLFFLGTNILRMHGYVIRRDRTRRIPVIVYIKEAWKLVYHAATQKRFLDCEEEKNTRWITHFILVLGYVTMLVLVVGFLKWFQTDEIYPFYHPQRWIGYFATVALIYGAADALWGRIKKEHQMHRFSHISDWIFPILLLATTLTGILVHTFRYLEIPLFTYYIYAIHLAIAFPMLVLEVPFGKWSHLAYRPLAIYFQEVKEAAENLTVQEPSPALAGD